MKRTVMLSVIHDIGRYKNTRDEAGWHLDLPRGPESVPCTVFGYALWTWLLRHLPASTVGFVSGHFSVHDPASGVDRRRAHTTVRYRPTGAMIPGVEPTNTGGQLQTIRRENLSSNTMWEDIVGYSRAVRVGNHVYVAGTTATNEQGEVTNVGDPYKQSVTVLDRISVALEQIGSCLADVVRVRIYVTDIGSWREVARAHKEYFDDIRPATTLVEASSLVLREMEVEIEVEAVIHEHSDS